MNVLVMSPIDPDTLIRLSRKHHVIVAVDARPDRLERLARDREAFVFRSGVQVTADLMRRAPRLRLLVRAGSGLDNVDLEHVAMRGLELVRIPEPGARAVAELAFGLMLALARNIVLADGLWRRGRWVKHEFTGHTLQGKVLGIVGVGSIGRTVGKMGAAWGMEVVGCVGHPSVEVARRLASRGIWLSTFDRVVERADFLSIHLPLTASTRNLFDGSVLSRMKPGSFLINLSRGGVVDEEALRRELIAGGRLRGAALDVHAAEGEGQVSPLAGLHNVILTPHLGSTTVDTQREIGRRIESVLDECSVRLVASRRPSSRRTKGGGVVPGTFNEGIS
jgi:D-3-phosphoglycerate dehydrogenase / 2-oxoglutarate reductase